MQENLPEFSWSPTSEQAAILIAKGDLTYGQIAASLKVDNATVWRWRQHPGFKARVDELLDEIRSEIRRVGIADVMKRVNRLNDRAMRMSRVIEARAEDPSMANVPGGTTGLMVRSFKMIGSGENATMVEEYEVDTALLKEMREHEKQAAQELGQWTEKKQIDDARKAYDVQNTPDDL